MNVNLNVYPYCHSFYQELIECPPEGVRYTGLFELGDQSYVNEGNISTRGALFLENKAEKLWEVLGKPSMRPAVRGDLVHSERVVLGRQPYVTSFDHVGFLTDYRFERMYELAKENAFERYLSRNRCRKLLPWSEAAADSFRNVVGNQFADKLDVVYPAVAPVDVSATHDNNGPLRILFVATDFYLKGGAELLKAFENLDFEAELTVISDVPSSVISEYSDENIQFENPSFTRRELYDRFYRESDVFVHPTHNDSFGMVLLEAMNAALPVISTNVFAVSEIIDDGETGFVVDKPSVCLFDEDKKPKVRWSTNQAEVRKKLRSPDPQVVDGIVNRLQGLNSDPNLRETLGKQGEKRVSSGRFSIQHRNTELRDIYADAIGGVS